MVDENLIAHLAKRKVVSDTFRRLDPVKKELIYRTAVRQFGVYGYDGLPVDRFCAEARISKGSFFQYFPSKSHLLEFTLLCFDNALARWIAHLREKEKTVLARDRIKYLYEVLVLDPELDEDERKFYQFATHAIVHAGVIVAGVDLDKHIRAYVDQIIERGAETGELRRDQPVEVVSHLANALVRGLVDRAYVGRRSKAVETADDIVSFLFDGIKA